MNNVIEKFKRKFYKIRDMGYVESVNHYSSGIGLTFEKLLGKEVDNFPFPDFENEIEVKVKLAFSKKPIHLFNLSPDGNGFVETKDILDKYGYKNTNNKQFKSFNGTITANVLNKIGYYFYFTLKIDYKEEKVKLLVFDFNGELIDNSTFWKFDKIENALYRKLKCLALIQAWPTKKDGKDYYKYYRYDLYKISNFYTFLNLLDKGVIKVTFSIDTFQTEKKYGQIHDHGTTFDINKEDLEKLFFKIS